MKAVRPDIARLEQNGITAVAFPRLGDPAVIPLWFGEGDLVTPPFIRDAAKQALDEGNTFYVHTSGLPALRQEIKRYLDRLYGLDLHPDRIAVPGSAMLGITMAAQMALNKGDEALVVTPNWPNIDNTYAVTGARVNHVRQRETKSGWQLTAEVIIDAMTPGTRSLFVNSPCNPTGWVASRQVQEQLLQHCIDNDVLLIADEVYHRHYYAGKVAPSFLDIAGDSDPVIVVNGFSKAWAMTGWRLGWVVAPVEQATHWMLMSECFNTGGTVFAQHAGISALRDGEDFVAELKAQYLASRDLTMSILSSHPAIDITAPEGAFYAFPRISGLKSSRAFAEQLLEEEDVGVAPGYTFGAGNEEYIRICFALGRERLEEGLHRIIRFVNQHHNKL